MAVAMGAGLVLSLSTALFVRAWERETISAEFEHRADSYVALFQKSINRNVELLNTVAALYAASSHVGRRDFAEFTRPLIQRHPGIQALQWVPRVSGRQRADYERRARLAGIDDFQFKEWSAAGEFAPAPLRSEYLPVYFVEPLGANAESLGADLVSNATLRRTLDAARHQGTALATPWINLAPAGADPRYGFMIVRPVYRRLAPINGAAALHQDLRGYVLGIVSIGEMVKETLRDQPPSALDLWLADYDGATAQHRTYFHRSRTRSPGGAAEVEPARVGGFTKKVELRPPGQRWSLSIAAAPMFFHYNNTRYAVGILIVGILMTGLLAAYLLSQARRAMRTMRLANKLSGLNADMAREIQERRQIEQALSASEEKSRALVECAPDAITVLDGDTGQFLDVNKNTEQLFAMSRDQLLKVGLFELSPCRQPDGRHSLAAGHAYMRLAARGESQSFVWLHKKTTGDELVCEVRLMRLPDPQRLLLRASISDITERRRSEHLRQRLGRILDESSNEIYVFAADTLRFVQANKGARDNLGYSMRELSRLTPVDLKPEYTEQRFLNCIAPLRRGERDSILFTTTHQRKDGSLYPVEVRLQLSRQERPPVFVAIIQDITQRLQDEAEMQKLSSIVEQTTDIVVVTSKSGEIEYINTGFERMTGYSRAEALGQNMRILKSGKHDSRFYAQMWETIAGGQPFRGIFLNRKKNGDYYYEEKTIAPLKDRYSNMTKFVSTGKDITDRMLTREHIEHLAFHDALTDLPNRQLFKDRLRHAIGMVHNGECKAGVLFLDLDRFKLINDSLGHDVGDQLLKQVAGRLLACVRKSDTVARFGGDEFILLVQDMDDAGQCAALASKIAAALGQPIRIGSHKLFVTASIGITICPDHGTDVETLISRADIAMYHAKALGRDHYQLYSDDMSERVMQRAGMEADLRGALERKELRLHFQPIYSLHDQRSVGVEALLRWRHPKRGFVSPVDFIPVLEESGMIAPVTNWILEQACVQCRRMGQGGREEFSIAVNVSASCFYDAGLVQQVQEALRSSGLSSDRLILEITESTLFQHTARVRDVLTRVREMGVRIALDDFGTGQSSLNHLRAFPIDIIKIDRDFIHDIPNDENDCELVAAIVAIAHNLNKRVVAEGVETAAQLDFLRRHGCDTVQGHLFSAAAPAEQIGAVLSSGEGLSAVSL